MKLLELFFLEPAPIRAEYVRRVVLMDPMPEPRVMTPALIEQCRQARLAQVGKTKAPNRGTW